MTGSRNITVTDHNIIINGHFLGMGTTILLHGTQMGFKGPQLFLFFVINTLMKKYNRKCWCQQSQRCQLLSLDIKESNQVFVRGDMLKESLYFLLICQQETRKLC